MLLAARVFSQIRLSWRLMDWRTIAACPYTRLLHLPLRAGLRLPAAAAVAPLLVSRKPWVQLPQWSPAPTPPLAQSRPATAPQSPPQTHSQQGKSQCVPASHGQPVVWAANYKRYERNYKLYKRLPQKQREECLLFKKILNTHCCIYMLNASTLNVKSKQWLIICYCI